MDIQSTQQLEQPINPQGASQQVMQQTPLDPKSNKVIKILLLCIGIIVLLGIVVGSFLVSQKSNKLMIIGGNNPQKNAIGVQLPSATPPKISTWQTYLLNEIGMKIQYPNDWSITTQGKPNRVYALSVQSNKGIGFLNLVWGKKQTPPGCPNNGTNEPITFAGKMIDACHIVSPKNHYQTWSLIDNENNNFETSVTIETCYQNCSSNEAQNDQIIKQIAASIIFDKELFDKAKWITYDAGIYSISYPSSWSIKKDSSNPTNIQLYDPTATTPWNGTPTYSNGSTAYINITTMLSSLTPSQYVDNILPRVSSATFTSQQKPTYIYGYMHVYSGEQYTQQDQQTKNIQYVSVLSNGNSLVFLTRPYIGEYLILNDILSTFKLVN